MICSITNRSRSDSTHRPRADYPIEVKLAAYQWRRYGDKPVSGARPIMQTFLITG
jgi:hypothetical protein